MEENGVSKPQRVHQLRSAVKNLGWTVAQVIDRAKQADCDISDSTIRRILSDSEPAEKNYNPEFIRALEEIVFGDRTGNFDPSKARLYFDECRELRESMNELKVALADRDARLDHYRNMIEKESGNSEFLRTEILFLRERLTFISSFVEAIKEKFSHISDMLQKLLSRKNDSLD